MLESVEKLRETADECTKMAGVKDKFETVWITKAAFLRMLDDVEHEHEKKLHDATCKAHADGERSAKQNVEDLLWDLLANIQPDMEDEDAVPIVESFAEKLQLRGKDE